MLIIAVRIIFKCSFFVPITLVGYNFLRKCQVIHRLAWSVFVLAGNSVCVVQLDFEVFNMFAAITVQAVCAVCVYFVVVKVSVDS